MKEKYKDYFVSLLKLMTTVKLKFQAVSAIQPHNTATQSSLGSILSGDVSIKDSESTIKVLP